MLPATAAKRWASGASGLTLTFGFGAGLFDGIATAWPGAGRRRWSICPAFNGDQLVPEHSGGDLSIQACADDPQVAFHAVRQLVRLADGVARVRWAQTGFLPETPTDETPRNLMGFKDGTRNAQRSRCIRLGRRRRTRVDAWRQLCRGAQDPHGAGALGQDRMSISRKR